MKFKKKRTWISPERYGRLLKLLLSDNENDFLIGSQILAELDIKPKVLLNGNIKDVKYTFYYKKGILTRANNHSPGYALAVDNNGWIIENEIK